MRNAPVKIVLIRAGKYEYGEVDLNGSIQIVGGNNAGKTTLINTLQFLYIDERTKMSFHGYTLDKTLEYYFPTQYSYVLFECRTLRGKAVIGWRGTSKVSNAGPERFVYLGPYMREDYFTESGQVREPQDIWSKLGSSRELQLTPKPVQHREFLLAGAGERGEGLGIISLKDNDKFHHFRETLKNLLSLTKISQEQMRQSLLMLAEIPTDQPALERSRILGDDHGRLDQIRNELQLFIKHEKVINDLLREFSACQQIRGELMYRWIFLQKQKEQFTRSHDQTLATFDQQIGDVKAQEETKAAMVDTKRLERDGLIEQRTTFENRLQPLPGLAKEFAGFAEELERAALSEVEKQVVNKQVLLVEAATEKLEAVEERLNDVADKLALKERSVQHFGQLAIVMLREEFTDNELSRIFAILSPELLEYPLGKKGITLSDRESVLRQLRVILTRTKDSVYQDNSLTIRFRPASAALAKLESVEKLEMELAGLRKEKERLENLKDAVVQRQKHQEEFDLLVKQKNQQATRIHRFEQYQLAKSQETAWQKSLDGAKNVIFALDATIQELNAQKDQAKEKQTELRDQKSEADRQAREILKQFGGCDRPLFDATPATEAEIFPDFDSAISQYLRDQEQEKSAAQKINGLFLQVQGAFGDRYQGANESGTVRLLRENLDAVAVKEEALKHDWNAHIHGLKRRFQQVLDDLAQVQNAATKLNGSFKNVQISDLKGVKLSIEPHTDTVSLIKRIADLEELDLWSDQTPLNTALARVREWLDKTPIVRIVDLFTLDVSITGADGVTKHYPDFQQVESDGTTVVLKVLFNLLVLKSQLRKEDVAVPFYLDEVERLDDANLRAVIQTAKQLGFIAITAGPRAIGEVDACYFPELLPSGRVWLTPKEQVEIQPKALKPSLA